VIHLHTGLPGAGKTLCTLVEVKARAEREARPVYYSGISDLKLPWIELEKGEDWYTCPAGSIIVIDECQRVFRPRGNGSQVPECVAKFETHRHNGHDVYLITQHPMLLDSNIRRLVGRHCHVMRAFGANGANVHEWGEVREQVDKNRSGSQSTLWKYPKEVFTWYKSAEVHTHRLRIPPRLFFLVLAPFLIAGLVYGVYQWWKPRIDGTHHKDEISKLTGKPVKEGAQSASGEIKDRAAYLEERIPRIAGLLHTAPLYDDVTKAVDAPVPAGCIQTSKRCSCVDQQGADYLTDEVTCQHIVKHGMFVAWRSGSKNEARRDMEQRPMDRRAVDDPGQDRNFAVGPAHQLSSVKANG